MREPNIPLGGIRVGLIFYKPLTNTHLNFLLLDPAYRKKKYAPKMMNKTKATTSVGVKVARSCKSS